MVKDAVVAKDAEVPFSGGQSRTGGSVSTGGSAGPMGGSTARGGSGGRPATGGGNTVRDAGGADRDAQAPKDIGSPCVPEDNAEFCRRLGKTCGNLTANDRCGTQRAEVLCGTCEPSHVCNNNVCMPPGGVARPSNNTGSGFFVANGKLYDANGAEFRIRGVNKVHYDTEWPGIPKTHANTIRWVAPVWIPSALQTLIKDSIAQKIVPMPGIWYTSDAWSESENVTCKEEKSHLVKAVDLWVARAAMMKPFERQVLVNIANEWGPEDSTVWRDAYIEAVARMRAAGYLSTLVIDSGGCGQDPNNIIKYAQAVYDSDPQRNIVFDVHIYGLWVNGGGESWQTDLKTNMDRLAATKLPVIIGEFGPGRDIGPSPTSITPGEIITACEARGLGWLAWAWDDPAYNVGNDWFSMSFTRDYKSSADLTIFGKDVVENPTYGLLRLGQPATIF